MPLAFFVTPVTFIIALWSRGRLDGSKSEGPWFDLHVRQKLLTISQMDVLGQPHNWLGAGTYYYVIIDTLNDMPSDLE